MMRHPLLLALATFVLSAALAVICKRLGRAWGIVARPKADRWHRETVPMLGGVAMVVPVLLMALVVQFTDRQVWMLLAGGAVLALVGLWDDVRPLRPQSKLSAQLVVAAAAAALGLQLTPTGVLPIDMVITLLWIVGLTNAFNLLDNMDGLAAGIAAIAAGVQMVCFLMAGQTEPAALAAIFLGATLGFLVHNFQPASIFMGDVGSLFLGFFVSLLSLVGNDRSTGGGTLSLLLVPVLVVLVPIFDTSFVTIGRLLAGRPVSQGGRDHTSHRLVASGLSERGAVLVLYVVALIAGAMAVYTRLFGLAEIIVVLVLFGLCVAMLGLHLTRSGDVRSADAPPGDAASAAAVAATPANGRGRLIARLLAVAGNRQVAVALVDVVLIVAAYYAAYRLRFEQTFALEEPLLIASLPIVIACKMAAFGALRAYQDDWRYTGMRDLLRIIQAATLGTVLSVLAVLFLFRFQNYSRALFVLDWLLLLVFAGGSRLGFRMIGELLQPAGENSQRVLIYGAGEGGVMLLRELRSNRELARTPVGYLDDDRSKQRTKIQGLPVLGGIEQIEALLDQHDVVEVIVSSSKIDADQLAALREACTRRGVRVLRAVLRLE
jgi:UDP-GlcNAc:undecaprenyl-phosphate GlcNAc-1-phosphate transferase